MVKVLVEYNGDLHCTATHEPSKSIIYTDAPVDNQGKGEAFSPTDLVGTALGTCIATIMGIHAKRRGIALEGMTISVEKEMSDNPRRISKLSVAVNMPKGIPEKERKALENIVHQCPVHKSLHPDIQTPVVFHYAQ